MENICCIVFKGLTKSRDDITSTWVSSRPYISRV
jgi:hypothetical protein